MDLGGVLVAIHLAGAGAALILTERERLASGRRAWLGLPACLLWPLVVAVMLIAIRQGARLRD